MSVDYVPSEPLEPRPIAESWAIEIAFSLLGFFVGAVFGALRASA